jgi:hypothetical protein
MLEKSRSARLLTSFGLVLLLAFSVFADTLRLKDGSIIKGRIVGFGSGKFTVVVGEGARQRQMTFDAEEVESIQFEAVASRSLSNNQPQEKDPQFIETSAPPKSIPRVVTKDTVAGPAQTASQPKSAPAERAEVEPSSPRIGVKPVEISVKVLADNTSNGWTNSGWVVKKGQRIKIVGSGTVSLGKGKSTNPSGLYDLDDASKLLKSVPTGALIAVVGDDNNEFIYVGSERTFTATRDGALFLGVNEGNLNDNSGTFDVRIEIEPN